jgi:hypothetical protein
MKTRMFSVTYTRTRLIVFGFPSRFDPIDDIMFLPLRAPERMETESESLRLEIVDRRHFEEDLTQWSSEVTRDYICRKIVKAVTESIWLSSSSSSSSSSCDAGKWLEKSDEEYGPQVRPPM